ncbi:MAG: hypothetical protein NC112_09650 [Oxalobacter formigenes]|nr:hypothetical protein [Oxalobacter formigenes]
MKLTTEEAEKRLTPAFSIAMHEYIKACEKYGEDSETANRLWAKAILLAPPAFLDDMAKMAKEEKLIPEPDGYLEDGTPVISSTAIAAHLDMPHEEVMEKVEELIEMKRSHGLPSDGIYKNATVYRKQ